MIPPTGFWLGSLLMASAFWQAGEPVRVGELEMNSRVSLKVVPVYPEEARRRGLFGQVHLEAVIDEKGEVAEVRIMEGHPLLDRAAMEAVRCWMFRPLERHGRPVSVSTTVTVSFALEEGDATSGGVTSRVESMKQVLEVFHRIPPHYLAEVMARYPGAGVSLELHLNDDGSIQGVTVVEGPKELRPAALEAVRQWRFRNPRGEPTRARVEFQLPGGKPAPLVVGAGDWPRVLRRVEPAYPPAARRARVQGTVLMQVWIDQEGKVSDVKVIRGHSLLDEAAIEAVRQWRYETTWLRGEPVAVIATVALHFRLPRER